MAFRSTIVRRAQDATDRGTLRAVLSEFISTLIFVFAASSGSSLAVDKPAALLIRALATAFALSVAVAVGTNNSGGHVNPAVSFGAFIGGNLTFNRCFFYWIAQLLGSIAACFLVKFGTQQSVPAIGLSGGVNVGRAVLLETVMTFGLVFAVYATAVDPMSRTKDRLENIAPIVIGFIVGANILVAGPFDGASMNPAASFGPALVSWTWKNHWVYWVGPLLGGGLAGFFYELLFVSSSQQSWRRDYF
ncbi:hypothetical protein Fmac_027571 [Flemingia macrophylla]|uniref:Uncharacterized protein n=1 Tax=Flemingia macrophylla TaxID=520843 RepID=A0ABD1LI90_9FABA